SLGVRVSTGNRWDKQLANHLFVVISVDEFVKAMVAAVEAGGQRWSLLRRKKSHGGTCLLPGRICVGDRSTRRQWLAVPSPMVARLKMTTGCGGCSIGDCGRVEGARRQRATTMEEEEDGSVGPSKDGADMATVEKGDGSVEGGDDYRGGEGSSIVGGSGSDGGKELGVGRQRVVATAKEGDGNDDSKGGVRLRWTEEKGQGDGSAGGSASEDCTQSRAVLWWLLRLLQSSWCCRRRWTVAAGRL
ncbi:hypothetical protein BHE74_00056794, partial [Ensete ventricosum]